jgi:membrane protease YdiL (CAAX protease family)
MKWKLLDQRRLEMTTIADNTHTGRAQEKYQVAPAQETSQYTLWQILGIWAIVTLPMVLLTWIIAPAVIPYSPLHPGITYWLLTIIGMGWQFVVSLVIIYRELGTLRWSAIRQRTWLQTPRDPKTDQPNLKLFWWLLPVLFFSALVNLGLASYLDAFMTWLFPALQAPPFMEMEHLASAELQGQWWLLGVAVVSIIFNYFLGEEFLFRGVLLPKMQGVFGKYDWVANAVIFSFYHLHKPWTLPTQIVGNLAYSWPARRFRSNWMAIIVHGVEGFLVLAIVLAAILGMGG